MHGILLLLQLKLKLNPPMAHTDGGYVHQEADCTRQLQQQGAERQDHESLLVKAMEVQKALEVPKLQHPTTSISNNENVLNSTNSSQDCLASSNGSGSLSGPILIQHHSDLSHRQTPMLFEKHTQPLHTIYFLHRHQHLK